MLDTTYQTKKVEKKEYPLISEGIYQVVLEDIKPVLNNTRNGQEERWTFQYVICDEGEFMGQKLFQRVNPVVSNFNNNPSWLFSIIKALRNQEPSEDEIADGFTADDVNKLIGQQAIVMVKQTKDTKGRVWANIDGIMAAKKVLPTPELKTTPPTALEEASTQVTAEPRPVKDTDLPF